MLGEAARTKVDALQYFDSYVDSIAAIAKTTDPSAIQNNLGISVKLSALHPRYEATQQEVMLPEMVARLLALVKAAAAAGIGLNIDAEESDRLDLSLVVLMTVLSDSSLQDWDGFGVVVQAYGKRAPHALDWLYTLAGVLKANHGASGEGGVLGQRDQARPGPWSSGLSGLYPQSPHRCELLGLRPAIAGDERSDLSTICDPQCTHGRGGTPHGRRRP